MCGDEDSLTAKEARQKREAARAELLQGWDRIHRHDAPAGAKACQCAKTIGTDWEKDDGDEREAPRSATDRLDHLHKQLVALEIGATQTRAVLREWMGAAPFDDRQDRQAPNGLFAQLETTVNDLRTILEDIQVLVGGEQP